MFTLEGSVWTNSTKLEQSDGLENDAFGTRVAISPEVAVVGAPESDLMGYSSGSTYVFAEDRETGEWEELKKLQGSETNAALGSSVAIRDDVLFTGAPGNTVDDAPELISGRSIFDFTSYIKSMDEGDNRDW